MEHTESIAVVTRTLQECEADIEQGFSAFLKVGRALLEIRNDRLYLTDEYKTFEDYCRGRWGFSRSIGYDYVNATLTHDRVGTSLQSADLSFSHFVVLSRLLNNQDALTSLTTEVDMASVSVRRLTALVDGKLQGEASEAGELALADTLKDRLERQRKSVENLIEKSNPDETAKKRLASVLRDIASSYRKQARMLAADVIEGNAQIA